MTRFSFVLLLALVPLPISATPDTPWEFLHAEWFIDFWAIERGLASVSLRDGSIEINLYRYIEPGFGRTAIQGRPYSILKGTIDEQCHLQLMERTFGDSHSSGLEPVVGTYRIVEETGIDDRSKGGEVKEVPVENHVISLEVVNGYRELRMRRILATPNQPLHPTLRACARSAGERRR